MLAVIGGSGLTQLANLDISHRQVVRTPFGEPSGPLVFGRIGSQGVVFLARHGYGHTIPPHRVNYRANIWALARESGATRIVSVASVGGIRRDLGPGTVVIPHQILDYTAGRDNTFFEGGEGQVVHVDFTHPYDEEVRSALLRAAEGVGEAVVEGAVYATTQGPRLETAAEVDRLERDGADIVGMTGMPEAVLARELEVPYAALCVVANWGAGRADSSEGIQFEQIEDVLHQSLGRVRNIIAGLCTESYCPV
ncbi:MAG TPA: S-methyl-5'-thioinosine phosphorylase [Rhodocyclaceae bacterium]